MATTLARNSAFNAIAGLATTLGGFLSSILVARLLGVEGTGVVAFATWLVTMAIMVADLGVPGALARFLPELETRGERGASDGVVRLLFRPFIAAVSAVASAFMLYGAWVGSGTSGQGWHVTPEGFRLAPLFWLLVGLACLSQAAAGLFNGYLKGRQDFPRMAVIAVASAALQLACTFLGGLAFGIAGAMTGAVAAGFLPALLLWRVMPSQGSVPADLRARIFRFSRHSWGAYLVNAFAWSRMEIFFIQRSWGSEGVGLFAVGLTLSNLASQGPLLLTGALLPYFAQHIGAASAHKAKDAYATGMRILAAIVFPACLGLAAVAPTLLPLIYGQDFAEAVPITTVLVCASALSATASVAFTYMLAMERSRFVLIMGGLGAILSIVSGLTIVPAFGPFAAACTRGAIQVGVAAVIVSYVVRYLETPTPFGSLLRLFAAAALSALAAAIALLLVAAPAIIQLLVAVPVGVGVYGLAVRALHALPKSDVDRLVAASSILPRPLHGLAAATLRLLAA